MPPPSGFFEARRGLAGLLAAALSLLLSPPSGASPRFVDRAAELGLDFEHFNGMSGELYFSEMMGSGVALLDYDGDGDLDVYLVQGHMLGEGKEIGQATFPPRHPLPLVDRLYRNDLAVGPKGAPMPRFVDVTERSGIVAPGYGMGVATADYDNDGWLDLYVTNLGANQLWRNNGNGTFRDVTAESGTGDRLWGVSAAFFDYDRDGWLDLYVGNYVDFRLATHKACISPAGASDYCGPLAFQPEPDRLFRNRGDGTFEEVSVRAGLQEAPGGALGVVTADFNDDGWIDVYVANDQVPNKLWMNQGNGTFLNDALLTGSAVNEEGQPEASMGLVVGDINGDGSEDLFMAHLTRETNTLYLNDGSGMFMDSTRDSGLGIASWKWTGFGVALFDYDLDAWLDLYVTNGAVKLVEELARRGDPYPIHQPDQLYHNLGGGRFEEVSAQAGAVFQLSEVGRGIAVGDVDHDGDPDVVLSNSAGPVRLLVNESERAGSWLGLRALGGGAPRDALGALVDVTRGDRPPLRRRIGTDGSYASARDPRLLFGLGEHDGTVGVAVRWPRGGRSEWHEVPQGVQVTLWEGGGAGP